MVRTISLCLLLLGGSACVQDGISDVAEARQLDAHYFRCRVQPILTKSCAFMDCHGNDERPMRVFAEQRYRLNKSWLDFEDPIEEEELAANLRVMAGFVENTKGQDHLLSEKPLDARFGGRYHRGRDLYGRDDVFLSREDPDYKTLVDFANGAEDAPDCLPDTGATP